MTVAAHYTVAIQYGRIVNLFKYVRPLINDDTMCSSMKHDEKMTRDGQNRTNFGQL